jgi:hypothetical protein
MIRLEHQLHDEHLKAACSELKELEENVKISTFPSTSQYGRVKFLLNPFDPDVEKVLIKATQLEIPTNWYKPKDKVHAHILLGRFHLKKAKASYRSAKNLASKETSFVPDSVKRALNHLEKL